MRNRAPNPLIQIRTYILAQTIQSQYINPLLFAQSRTQSPHSNSQIYSCANNPISIYKSPLICAIARAPNSLIQIRRYILSQIIQSQYIIPLLFAESRTQSPHSNSQIYSCANNPISIYNPPLICVIAHPIPSFNPAHIFLRKQSNPIYKSPLICGIAHPIPSFKSTPNPIRKQSNPIYKSPLICVIAHPIPSFKSTPNPQTIQSQFINPPLICEIKIVKIKIE